MGTKTPPRLLVRFVAPAQEGREEWVPPGRLKVPWSGRQGFLAREQRWASARAVAQLRGTTIDLAISEVFDHLPDWTFAQAAYNNDTGLLKIHDMAGLLGDLALEPTVLEHPLGFVEDGVLIVPWPVTQVVVRRLAERHADLLLPIMDEAEKEAEQQSRWGTQHGDTVISAEICAETDREFRPVRELVRQWCGQPGRERHDELAALRIEVVRLGELVESAVAALRAVGEHGAAARIERELGVPVALVRAHRDHHTRRDRGGGG